MEGGADPHMPVVPRDAIAEDLDVAVLGGGWCGVLAGYHLLPATRADLLRRLDRRDEAAAAYREALSLAGTDAERRYLIRRLAQVSGGTA